MNTVRTRLIKIGNSNGVRIPKPFLGQLGPGSEVEISAERGKLVIRPAARPRQGWEEHFRTMAERGDDRLLDEPASTEWDSEEWHW